MKHLIEATRDAIAKECWYPALTLALALPDACSAIERPGRSNSRERYATWADTYFAPYVTGGGVAFLTGAELYKLRCAFLHEADLQVGDEEPQDPDCGRAMFEVLNEVVPYVSEMDIVPSRCMSEGQGRRTSYHVAVKDLCEWICCAAEDWLTRARSDERMSAALAGARRIMRMHLDARRTPL